MTKGQRIKNLREHIGKSQTAFADMINVSKQTLYKYENDIITNIPSDKIEIIARICNSSPAYIMGWDENEQKLSDHDLLQHKYKKLNDEGKQKLNEFLDLLLENAKYTTIHVSTDSKAG